MLYQILLIILPLITTPYVSRVLGADGVGIYNYTYSVVTAFTLVAVLGTNSFAIREVAYIQCDRVGCSRIFYEVFAIRCATTMIVLPFYILSIVISGKYTAVYIATVTYLVSVPFDITWFFQGLEDFKKTITISGILRIAGIALIFIFVKAPADVARYTFIMGGTCLLGNILLWLYVPKYLVKFNKKYFHPQKHLKAILIFFIPALSTYIYTSLDKIVLGILSTEAEVGYYSQSEKIIKLLITIIVSLSTVLMPRMANLIRNGRINEVKESLNNSYTYVLFISLPMMMGLAALADYFVPLFFGSEYEKSIVVMKILIPLVIIMGMSSMTGTTVMIAMGKQKQYNQIIVSASIINLLLNIILVKNYASIGVAVATIAAELFVTVAEMFNIREFIDFHRLIKSFLKYGLNAICMLFVVSCLKGMLACNWLSILYISVVGVIMYFVILLIEKDKMIMKLITLMKRILHR